MLNIKGKLPIVIALIILGALAISLLANLGISLIKKKIFPDDYLEHVEKYASEYNIPEYVILAVIKVESDFDPNATSRAGAMGLMQMLPSTFTWLSSFEHLNENLSYYKLYDPEVSIRYGTYYLRYLFEKFHDWDTVFAAYNGGEGNVAKWLADPEYSDEKGNLTHIPFPETKKYVEKVNFSLDIYRDTYYKNEVSVK